MMRRLLMLLFLLSGCSLDRVQDRFAAEGRVSEGGGRGLGGALVQACSVNPISFSKFLDDPSFCEKEELVRSREDGGFTITSHREFRLGGLLFGPPHGSGEDYIYTVLMACHPDGFMGHGEVKYPNSKDVEVHMTKGQRPESIDVKRCSWLWNREHSVPKK